MRGLVQRRRQINGSFHDHGVHPGFKNKKSYEEVTINIDCLAWDGMEDVPVLFKSLSYMLFYKI